MNDSSNQIEKTLTTEPTQLNSDTDATLDFLPAPSNASSFSRRKVKIEPNIKPIYSKQAYRLPKSLDKAVRYSAFRLEDRPNAPQTPQAVVEKAVRNYIDLLKNKAKVDFPQDILDALAQSESI